MYGVLVSFYGSFSLEESIRTSLTHRQLFSYPAMSNSEALEKVTEGYRLPKPSECPDDVYAIMVACWDAEPNNRPTFPSTLNLCVIM